MKQPLVLELKGNSLDDGPGIRTAVFFKGCPLRCIWFKQLNRDLQLDLVRRADYSM